MDIEEEFEALGLPKAQKALAWEARAKVIWGDSASDVQAWLAANDVDPYAVDRIVAIAVRERAIGFRVKGIRDLVLGILIATSSAGVVFGVIMFLNAGLAAVPVRGVSVLVAFAFVAFMYGCHLTWRGLTWMIGGASIKGAMSDVEG